ncbi:MAG TPA: hypothetical protein EYP85_16700 [Armatimonadetes bacterium]|nr:hypothetical protein [Armatimonadota bacterium]
MEAETEGAVPVKPRWYWRPVTWAVLCALVVGVPFLNKPYHIDDTMVLRVAEQILADPLRPFSGEINWRQDVEPIFEATTNPPFLSYYLALFIALGGFSEPLLHTAMLLFLVVLAVAVVRLSERFAAGSLWPLFFVLFSPAVVVSSNAMRDVPVAALSAAAVLLFVQGSDEKRWPFMLAGSLLAGVAMLTKYSAVILFPVLALYLLLYRRWRHLVWVLPGLILLGLWCLQNLLVHGQTHLAYLMAERRGKLPWPDKFYAALVILGASLFLLPGLLAEAAGRSQGGLLAGGVVTALFVPLGVLVHQQGHPPFQYLLWAQMGGVLFYGALFGGLRAVGKMMQRRAEKKDLDTFFLAGWLMAVFLFSVILVPFQAVRHLIPALPPLVLLLMRELAPPGASEPRWLRGTLGALALLQGGMAFLVAVADYEYADTYRRFAAEATQRLFRPGQEVWFTGSWGWQFYARQAGFRQLAAHGPRPQPGDLLLEPQRVHKGRFPKGLRRQLVLWEEREYPGRLPLRTMNGFKGASFYAVVRENVPYLFTRDKVLEIFRVYRVAEPKSKPREQP